MRGDPGLSIEDPSAAGEVTCLITAARVFGYRRVPRIRDSSEEANGPVS
jgi:hypothetical protein